MKSNIKKFKTIISNYGFKSAFKLVIRSKIEFPLSKIIIKLKSFTSKKVISNPYQIIYVPTELIEYMYINPSKKYKINRNFKFILNRVRMAGLIRSGDWEKKKFINSNTMKIYKKRFLEGKDWEETLYYKKFLEQGDGVDLRKASNWNNFKMEYLASWDDLFYNIKNYGYKSQIELGKDNPINEIEILVSSNGELLLRDGRHRLATAKLLNIKVVPVIVNVWHEDYINKINNKFDYKNLTPKKAIEPIINKKLD